VVEQSRKTHIELTYIPKELIITAMTKNIGTADKIIRIVLGAAIIILGFFTQSWWGLIGILPLFTAFINFCPAYTIFGFTTCKTKKPE
jgi:hypothetical protein